MFINKTLFLKFPVLPVFMMPLTMLICNFAFPSSARANTITVNSTADVVADDAQCTLREAITSANSNAASGASPGECIAGNALGTDTIAFNIGTGGAQTITLGSLLPTISSRVTIDGSTQPGYVNVPLIKVDGNYKMKVFDLVGGSSNSTIKGLMIVRANYGVYAVSDYLTFQGNYIGTDGSSSLGWNYDLWLEGSYNMIGGTGANHGNLLSGTNQANLALMSMFVGGSTVQGNIIGTDATGSISLSTAAGIMISGPNNIVGGTVVGAGNLISGNSIGISQSNFSNTTIQGNKIGTNAAGTAAVSGSNYGIYINSAQNNTIGGSSTGAANLISGNSVAGIYIQNNDSTGNVIQGNYIGTNTAGTAAIPNGIGIWSEYGTSSTFGGSGTGQWNVISGNTNQGILVHGGTTNTVMGNKIGTNAAGTAALANNTGIEISGSGSTTVGGSSTGQGNLVSGNTMNGIVIQSGAFSTAVQGNFIGTNAAGNGAIPNSNGILIDNAPNTTIGGGTAGQGNLVSGNANIGIQIGNSTGHVVTGNKIGTDVVGSGSLPNGSAGIYLTGIASAQVSQNLIANHSGAGDFGIYLDSSALFAAGSIDNCVVNNASGVQNDTGSARTFINNWWGHTSGPSGAGPGSGDTVSTDVVFAPWLTDPPAACVFVLTVSISGTGAGTVTSTPQGTNPVGIACTTGVCTTSFPINTPVALTPSADNVSTFGIWGGDCAGSVTCGGIMNGPKTVSASFILAPKAKIVDIGYPSLFAAYTAAAASGAIIMTIDSEMPDNGLNINADLAQGKTVTINGGYYADYSGRSGLPTYLKGPLYISNGTLTVDGLSIR